MKENNQEVLFTITSDKLDSGLRGVPVGYCTTSTVDPNLGLYYAGKPIADMIDWEPERVIYLLYYGKDGLAGDIQKFTEKLRGRMQCSELLLDSIERLPRQGHPMKLFCVALLLAGMLEGTNDYREDCLNLIARIPQIAATVINYHAGWGKTPAPRNDLGYMDNFTHMVNVPHADKQELGELFRLFNILHYDHSGGNLSTFVGKAVASGLEDMYGSIVSAMCALDGPRHGRANQESLEFVQKTLSSLGESPSPKEVETYIRDLLGRNELVYGFGHAVLRVEDTRAKVLYELADKKYASHPMVKMARLLRAEAPKILKENPKITDPYPNVDAISGVLLYAAGFPYPEYFTLLFGLSRIVGIAIQIVYERCEAKNGKGTPIIRPKYIYKARST